VEVVPWITEQIDMLCTMLFLSSVFFFVKSVRDNKPTSYLLSLVLGFGSMLTKEHGVTLPAVLTAYCLCCSSSATLKGKIKDAVERTSLFWALLAVYFSLRFSAIGTLLGGYYGQNAESFATMLWRWRNFHGLEQLAFPVNQRLVDRGDPIFIAMGMAYLGIFAAFVIAWRAGARLQSNRSVFVFLTLWTVISAAPPLITWGLDKALAGSRHTYLVGVPFLLLFVGLFLSKVLSSREQQPADHEQLPRTAVAGIGAITGLLTVYLFATLLNTQSWFHAGVLMHNFQSSVSEVARQLPPGKKVALLYLPSNRYGAHLFYHSQHAELFKPPFLGEDLSEKIEFPIRTLFSKNAVGVNTAQVRELANRGYTFCYWDNKDGILRTVKIDLADQLNLPLEFVKTARTSDDTTCRYVFRTQNPDDFRRAEFIEFKARSAKNKGVKAELTWDTSVNPGFVERKLQKVICKFKPALQFSIYHFPVSESKNWLCSQHTGLIYFDAPRDLELDTSSLRLIDGHALVPKLSFTGTGTERRGLYELGQNDVCEVSYDASAIPGSHHLKFELSRPSVAYESLLPSLRTFPASHVTAKSAATKNNVGRVKLPLSTFPKKASFEFRVSARDKEGKLVGYFSDPVSIILKPARW
jgi:hypothetical protein